MASGSPTAALAPARPASPLKALSFWGAGADPKPPPAFPAKMSKLWASTTAMGAIVRSYQSPAIVNAGLPELNLAAGKVGGAGGWRLWAVHGGRRTGAGPHWRGRFPPPLPGKAREGCRTGGLVALGPLDALLEPPPPPSPQSQGASCAPQLHHAHMLHLASHGGHELIG